VARDRHDDQTVPAVGSGDADGGDLVLAPSSATYRARLGRAPAFLLVLAVVPVARLGWPGLVLALVTAAACLAGVRRYLRVARVYVTPTGVGRRSFWGHHRMVDRSDIGTILFVPDMCVSGETGFPVLYVLDRSTAPVVKLSGWLWSTDEMQRLVDALGSEAQVMSGAVGPKDVGRRYPGAVAWRDAHPWRFALALVAGLMAAGVTVAFLLGV